MYSNVVCIWHGSVTVRRVSWGLRAWGFGHVMSWHTLIKALTTLEVSLRSTFGKPGWRAWCKEAKLDIQHRFMPISISSIGWLDVQLRFVLHVYEETL